MTSLKRGIRFRDLALFYVVVTFSIRWIASAAAAGPSILVIWVAALLFFFIPLAASVMELSSRLPQEGGIYLWTREAFGSFPGFLAAWCYWMSNLPFFAAILYFGGASALYAFGPAGLKLAASPMYFVAFASLWLAVITGLNIVGVNAGKWLSNVASLGIFLPLGTLLVLSAISYGRFGFAVHYPAASFVPHWSLDNAVFWSSVFFAFGGVESASAMGDEIENPRRTIPLAILVGGSILTFGYIAGTAALLSALPADAVGGPDGFVNGVRLLSAHVGMAWLLAPIALLVALNAVGGAAANFAGASRLPFVAGIDRYMPPQFGWIHRRFQTPWVAIAVYGIAGAAVALLGQAGTNVRGAYNFLVSMSVIAFFIPFMFLFASMIRLQRVPVGPEVRRVPGGRPVALCLGAVGMTSTAITIVLATIPGADELNKPLAVAKVIGSTCVLVGAAVAVFLYSRYKAGKGLGMIAV
jgi:amino acid transporter